MCYGAQHEKQAVGDDEKGRHCTMFDLRRYASKNAHGYACARDEHDDLDVIYILSLCNTFRQVFQNDIFFF